MPRAKKKKDGAASVLPPGEWGEKLTGVLTEIINAYGDKIGTEGKIASPVIRASDCPPIVRIPTGILAVDFVTGGGIPVKRFTEIAGGEGTSKTTLALLIIAAAQRLCGACYHMACDCPVRKIFKVAWIDVEGTLDKAWARALGVDIDNVLVSRSGFAEGDLDIATALLESGEINLLVFDSLAALSSFKEQDASFEDSQVGLNARLLSKAFRKWQNALNRGGPIEPIGPSILLINQYRSMIGQPGRVLTGGVAQRYAASVILNLSKGNSAAHDGKDQSGLTKWQEFKVLAKKSKVVTGGGLGQYRLWQMDHQEHKKGEVDEVNTVIQYAERYGVIEHNGKNWVWEDQDVSESSRPKFYQRLTGTPVPGSQELTGEVTLWDELRMQTIETILNEPVSRQFMFRNEEEAGV